MFPSTRNGSETTVPLAERGTKGGVNFWDRQRFRDPSPVLSFNLVAHLHRLTERFPELFTARLVNFVPLSYLSRPRSTPRYIYIYIYFSFLFFFFRLLSSFARGTYLRERRILVTYLGIRNFLSKLLKESNVFPFLGRNHLRFLIRNTAFDLVGE